VDWAREKVLVIGGSGFLGANIVHHLVATAVAVPGNIRTFSNRASHALDDLPDIERLEGDILDPARLERACEDRTLVFHAAGSTTFDPRLRRQQWMTNVEGTRNVLNAVLASPTVRRLCYTSTVNVLGCPWPDGSIGTEESCNPYTSRPKLHSFSSPEEALALADAVNQGRAPPFWWKRGGLGYFDSKLAAQELVNRAARDQGLDVVSVLPGTCFGPGSENPGPEFLLRAVLENRLPVVPRGGLPLAHVEDVARGLVLAVEKGRSGASYIVSGPPDDNRRFADMARIVAEVIREKEPGRAIRVGFPVIPGVLAWLAASVAEAWQESLGRPFTLSRPAVRMSHYALFYSSGRAAREIGYSPEKSFREAVRAMYESLR